MALKIYNSLSRLEEDFTSINPKNIGIYTCGPTVYDYVTIGNWRTYTLGDIVVRSLKYLGYEVNYYMNITDVGHLTGDNLGDADTGEDRMEKAKKREGKDAWAIADFYTKDFLDSYTRLNLSLPKEFLKATNHIDSQIKLIQKLFDRGLAYETTDGVYFDTGIYESMGFKYGELSDLDKIQEGARVEVNIEKKNPRDFALWKKSPESALRDMLWQSPWGAGFPGWHIECSAMGMDALGEQFDIHIGGEDLKSTHHPNEIAQSQGSTGKYPFVKYWLHGAFLRVDGGRMGKSLGNAYTLENIQEKGFDPMVLRYFYYTAHYRSPLNFTWGGLEAVATAYNKLKQAYIKLPNNTDGSIDMSYRNELLSTLEDDLNMPRALSVLWSLINDTHISDSDKKATLTDFDKIFGFGLENLTNEIPENIANIISARNEARRDRDFPKSDLLRDQLENLGYEVKDTENGTQIFKL